MSKFYILSGGREPVFLVDEDGASAFLDSLADAYEAAANTPMCMAHGFVIIEWDDGFQGAHT